MGRQKSISWPASQYQLFYFILLFGSINSCYLREERKNVIYRTFSAVSAVVTGGFQDLFLMEEKECNQRATDLRKGEAISVINFEEI